MAVLIIKVSHVETVPNSKQLLMFRVILQVARYDIFVIKGDTKSTN